MTFHIPLPTLDDLQRWWLSWSTWFQQLTCEQVQIGYVLGSYLVLYVPLSVLMVYLRQKGSYYHRSWRANGGNCFHEFEHDRKWLIVAFLLAPLTVFVLLVVSSLWWAYRLLLLPGQVLLWPLNVWNQTRSVKRGF